MRGIVLRVFMQLRDTECVGRPERLRALMLAGRRT